MVRALAPHQCGPGSNSGVGAICGLSLLLVLSLPPRGFSPGTPVFPSSQKPTFPNSNSNRNEVDKELLCGCATCQSLFIYLFIYLFCIDHVPYYLSALSSPHFFSATFLEIAVYCIPSILSIPILSTQPITGYFKFSIANIPFKPGFR